MTRTWRAGPFHAQTATDDGEDHPFVEGTTLTLSFHEGGRVGASSGCNSLDGQYAIEEGLLVITNAGRTEIGCDLELDKQENWYFDFLQSSPALTLDENDLTLTGDTTVIEYLDKEIATPDRDLVGPVWTVDTVIDGDAAGSADWSEQATFVFSEDGDVEVTTGCNAGSGGYTLEGDSITFDEVGVTEGGLPRRATAGARGWGARRDSPRRSGDPRDRRQSHVARDSDGGARTTRRLIRVAHC